MSYPDFFDLVKPIKVQDDLANFLGTCENGVYEITYKEVVNQAGHSCPTVASAYLMCTKALEVLFKNELPKRGEIKVEFASNQNDGVAGVVARVASQITGACASDGFGGIGPYFSRKNLLFFGSKINSEARFTRVDNGLSVNVSIDLSSVPPSSKQAILIQKIMQKIASEDETIEFKKLWQERVRKILIDCDGLEIIKIS